MTKVSIIVPIYNMELYLKECLDSILSQTLKEIEVVCIDDGSIDRSWEILAEYANADARILPIRQENQGVSTARNNGIKKASGKYLIFMDVMAVDIVPEKVELINNRKSPIQDEYIEKYLAEEKLDLTATLDAKEAYSNADYVVIVAPTNVYSTKSVEVGKECGGCGTGIRYAVSAFGERKIRVLPSYA